MAEAAGHKAEKQRPPGEPPPPGPPPVQLQVLRDVQPIFRDMLTDFHVRLTFQSYAPLRTYYHFQIRNQGVGTRSLDLIDVSDKSLDPGGETLLSNQEVMLELAAAQFRGDNLLAAVRHHALNLTLAVYHPQGLPEIAFAPSRELFKTHFEGKMLTFDKASGETRPAKWEEIGYKSHPGEGK